MVLFQDYKIFKFFQAKFASLFCQKIACTTNPLKLIAIIKFLLFDYSMLTIRIVEYYSKVKNLTNTNIKYHYSVPTIQIFKYSNSSNNSWQHWCEHETWWGYWNYDTSCGCRTRRRSLPPQFPGRGPSWSDCVCLATMALAGTVRTGDRGQGTPWTIAPSDAFLLFVTR